MWNEVYGEWKYINNLKVEDHILGRDTNWTNRGWFISPAIVLKSIWYFHTQTEYNVYDTELLNVLHAHQFSSHQQGLFARIMFLWMRYKNTRRTEPPAASVAGDNNFRLCFEKSFQVRNDKVHHPPPIDLHRWRG